MYNDKLIQDLEKIISQSDVLSIIPIQKGNSIRVGKYIVRTNKSGHLIYDSSKNKLVATTWSKSAALALVESKINNVKNDIAIKKLDRIIEKNDLDSLFYKNTIKKTHDKVKKINAANRLDIAKLNSFSARNKLYQMIIAKYDK